MIVGAFLLGLGAPSIAKTLFDSVSVGGDEIQALIDEAASGAAPSSAQEPIILRAPRAPERPEPSLREPPAIAPGQLRAAAYQFRTPVYFHPDADSHTAGLVRRGAQLAVIGGESGSGCERGHWFRVVGGYVCDRQGFRITAQEPKIPYQRAPDLAGALPYTYAAVVSDGAPRYEHLPTAAEERAVVDHLEALSNGTAQEPPSALERAMVGDYFVALDGLEHGEAGEYYGTVRGRYVRAQDIEVLEPPAFVGERIDASTPMPIAFVVSEQAPLYFMTPSGPREVGHAEHHARIFGVHVMAHGDTKYVLGRRGIALRREDVKLAGEIDRPEGVEADTPFVHVNLREQTLVAYGADGPVYATLVSSGKKGYETPTGLFRVGMKHVSHTMTGSDPVDGRYEVEEVPWTMYFKDSYALHGAYWHSSFGEPRSHGCVNLAPADARFVFAMVKPRLPAGWNTKVGKGTQVYVTR